MKYFEHKLTGIMQLYNPVDGGGDDDGYGD